MLACILFSQKCSIEKVRRVTKGNACFRYSWLVSVINFMDFIERRTFSQCFFYGANINSRTDLMPEDHKRKACPIGRKENSE